MTNYQHNHYYIQKDGRTVSDFDTLHEALEYVDKQGGMIVTKTIGELDCE